MTKGFPKLLTAAALLTVAVARTAAGGFLFATFKGEQTPRSEQIYFALSQEGRKWVALNGGEPVLVSTRGEKGVRDPFLLRSQDGEKFFLLATDLSINLNPNWGRAVRAGSRSLVIWESTNLVDWTEPRLVPVAAAEAGCTWAPEAVYDEETKDYLVFWASTSARDNFAKHCIWAARTRDFVSFSPPFVYIEKPWSLIDTTIVRDGGKYYRFSKDEEFKAITMETGATLTGEWQNVTTFSLAKVKGYEGPECFRLSGGGSQPATWCLILDQYSKGTGYHPFVTTNLSSGQFAPGTDFDFPFRLRHGSVLTLSAGEYRRLESRYPAAAAAK